MAFLVSEVGSEPIAAARAAPPCVLHEDDDLLVVNKPAGLNTHAPAPFAGEGLFDWLRHREPRWASLAIIHRLDKETSGVLVFARTRAANRALTEQFARGEVKKVYVLETDRPVAFQRLTVETFLARRGDRYEVALRGPPTARAITRFTVLGQREGRTRLRAEPLTGRTHQIRVHAAARGFPVLGDVGYGGTPAPRVHLHAAELAFRHPVSGERVAFAAAADFAADPRQALRAALIDPRHTTAWRVVHGAADGFPGWHVDRLGDFLLSQSAGPPSPPQIESLRNWLQAWSLSGAYHKLWTPDVPKRPAAEASPKLLFGQAAEPMFAIRENGVRLLLSFAAGYSVGLFLDQRENRRRLLTGHVGAEFPLWENAARPVEVLNTFAYTCGFSVCAALAGARTTSLDLSRHYLEWGRRNFALNGLEAQAHEFLQGDVFEWFKRLARRRRTFDVVLLDPPTFSRGKRGGAFQVEKHLGDLVRLALPLLRPGGVLFCSTNAAGLAPDTFLARVREAIPSAGRAILREQYVPQPVDFPIPRGTPGHLKTVWLKIA